MRIFSTIALVLISVVACGQDLGIIKVNKNYTATLKFESDVDLVVIANNPVQGMDGDIPVFKNYGIFRSGKMCILSLEDEKAPETAITVQLADGAVWGGRIRYEANYDGTIDGKTIPFYDFTQKEEKGKKKEKEKTTNGENAEFNKPDEEVMNDRLNQVMAMPSEYNTIGIYKNRMQIQVANIMNDDKCMYIKIVIVNGSASEFNINGVLITQEEGKMKKLNKKDVNDKERIIPYKLSDVNNVPGYQTRQLGYVIPLFATNMHGNLIIHFLEATGNRDYRIKVSAKELAVVRVFLK